MRSPLFYGLLTAPALAFAGHYNEIKVSIKLIDPDSLHLEVNMDDDDMLNAMGMFPEEKDTAMMRAYEVQTEAYLTSRLVLKVDGKGLPMRVVQWKPGGKGRQDGFDYASIYSTRQVITLGAALPKKREKLSLVMNVWVEFKNPTLGEVDWVWNGALLDRRWSYMEKTLTYPLATDSLVAAKKRAVKKPPPPSTQFNAVPDDHDDHQD
jgi:hypothetical protein